MKKSLFLLLLLTILLLSGCGARPPVTRDREAVLSWIDTLHGGIQATLLDEICGWVVFYQLQTSGVTAKMEMRYRKPVSTLWPYIRLNAKLVEQRRNIAIVHGEILSPEGVCCAECNCTYFIYSGEKSIEMGYIPARLAEEEVTLEEAVLLLGRL